ncbi:MAG: DUF2812 domain-containing protein [Lachnospiraceae bacterium]
MKDKKTVFKYFTIPEYNKEEQFLSAMHEAGWKLTHISFIGLYHFEKCEPEKVSYRLDYNPEGINNKDEYVQMFSDCGWEYLFDYVGYSYFRKSSQNLQENEEIFCDDESKLDMMKRVFKGRIVPLIIIFFGIIIPQLLINSLGHGDGSIVQNTLSICFILLAAIYLALFATFTYQLYRFEKKFDNQGTTTKAKYIGLMCVIVVMALFVGAIFFMNL